MEDSPDRKIRYKDKYGKPWDTEGEAAFANKTYGVRDHLLGLGMELQSVTLFLEALAGDDDITRKKLASHMMYCMLRTMGRRDIETIEKQQAEQSYGEEPNFNAK